MSGPVRRLKAAFLQETQGSADAGSRDSPARVAKKRGRLIKTGKQLTGREHAE
jgi:hypothetical protein